MYILPISLLRRLTIVSAAAFATFAGLYLAFALSGTQLLASSTAVQAPDSEVSSTSDRWHVENVPPVMRKGDGTGSVQPPVGRSDGDYGLKTEPASGFSDQKGSGQ